jgi:hypothetical protein
MIARSAGRPDASRQGGDLVKRWRIRLAGLLLPLLAPTLVLLPSCEWDGNFTILGYTTRPNYDTRYKTVRVNIFKNPTFWAVVPVPGLEMQLTQAIVREIEAKTPYKVVRDNADTELTGNIKSFTLGILNYNQLYERREVETTLLAEVAWRDLRTGKFLTAQRRLPGTQVPEELLPTPPALTEGVMGRVLAPIPATPTSPLNAGGTDVPSTPATDPVATTAVPPGAPIPPLAFQLVRSVGRYIPELGQSIATAQKENVDRMAIQIISMMEKPW